MWVELTETEISTIITALVLFAHIPKETMEEDQKRALFLGTGYHLWLKTTGNG